MNCFKKQKNASGLTLVEVMVASVILVGIIGIIYGAYFSGLDIWEISRFQADLQAQARNALNSMTSELKNATRTSAQVPSPNLTVPSVPNNKSAAFYLPFDKDGNGLIIDLNGEIEWDTTSRIDYQLIPGLNQLRRLEKGQHRVLANDVSDVQFIDAAVDSSLLQNEVRIVLTLNKTTPRQRNISITLSGIVALRN